MNSKIDLPSAKSIISTAASLAATAMLVRSVAKDFIPHELTHFFFSKAQHLLTTLFTNDITLVIDEFDGLVKNQLFHAAKLYIGTITGPSNRTFRASLPEKENQIHVSVGGNEVVTDSFRGSQLKWRLFTMSTDQPRHVRGPDEYGSNTTYEVRHLELTFHKKHKSTVLDAYLPYVLERSRAVKEEKKTLKLYTLRDESRVYVHGKSPWEAVNLDHPANFETLAMDGEMKSRVMDDLDRFVKRRELYRKVGKAWKRGYLLFGPPGTGKSSLVAAMANYLKFDVYDLELTSLRCNSDLRRLLISTGNRSILVVEDIDASIDLSDRDSKNPPPVVYHHRHDQGPKVTLSGLLNFIDGLWSSCGDERIIVFTTNHKEKLDPALLRPGRMDVHIHMSYCTPCGFKMLANNYLGAITTENNPLVTEAELLIGSTKVTPAEIGEQLLRGDDPEIALTGLIKFLDQKKEAEKEKSKDTTNQGLKELLKRAKATNDDNNVVRKDEAANNALKVLIGFLENEIGTGEANDSDSSSVATEIEIENDQNGTKSE